MEKIILFDGICIFCNSFVKFVTKHDHKKTFQFASLQSKNAEKLSMRYNFSIEQKNLSSVIFIKNGKVFKKSTAAILILAELGGLWNLILASLIIPQKLRNLFYDFFGRNRYRWFGKKEFCEFDAKEICDKATKD